MHTVYTFSEVHTSQHIYIISKKLIWHTNGPSLNLKLRGFAILRYLQWQRPEGLRISVKKIHTDYPDLAVKPISISQGAVFFPDHGSTKEEILEAADAALYRAKREGRDRVVIAELGG